MNKPGICRKLAPENFLRFVAALLLALSMSWFGLDSSPSLAQSSKHLPVPPHGQEENFKPLDGILQAAVNEGNIPGAVLLVGHNGKIVYRKAFGSRSLEPAREPMTIDTVFDLASLTKCIATTTSIMQLLEQGRLRLNDPVKTYLPDFAANGKQDITVRELLTHFSGLPEDLSLKSPWLGKDTAYAMVMSTAPVNPPGAHFLYSDINFETLGFLVEKISGQPLNEYAAEHIFKPLGMRDTGFLPPQSESARIAPTEYDEHGQMLRGIVHDPTARRMGGVAGHAGLFSTADDLALFAEDILHRHTVLSSSAVAKMSTPQQPANAPNLRGLGWDIDSPFASNRGELLPVGSFGHTGFTGTSLWIDPVTDTYIILLTNAVHPHVGKSVVSLRARVATAVTVSLHLTATEADKLYLSRITGYNESITAARRLTARNGQVKAGIDVLESHAFRELSPNAEHPVRIGLVANQTSVDSRGQRTADVLAAVPGIHLAAMFSPEHGVSGTLDTTAIGDQKDTATGAMIYSVYGDSDARRRPTAARLADIDIIVFDIQDIGVRFYTYESTMGYFLEAAARANKPILILDRPNLVNGSYVQGPVADENSESFVSYWRTPIRHGMTMGELASMFNKERNINARLTVVPMEGWQRGDWFDSTGLLWINPSPNMRSVTEAELYPGIGMIESTNISVGRGTDTPFEWVGAPWIQSIDLAAYLNARQIDGVRFVPVTFTPGSSLYANQKCSGVNIVLTDRNALDAPELGLEIASALQHLYPDHYKIEDLNTLLRHQVTLAALKDGQDPRRIADEWRDGLQNFIALRTKYLLY